MSKSNFRYNKKRKHYSYTLKEMDESSENILLTTAAFFEDKKYGKKIIRKNIPIYKHPNPNKQNDGKNYFIVNHCPYFDNNNSFCSKVYSCWKWNRNDKRKIKRFKKFKKYKKYFNNYGK